MDLCHAFLALVGMPAVLPIIQLMYQWSTKMVDFLNESIEAVVLLWLAKRPRAITSSNTSM
jgi:hypothetical protein